MSAISAELFVVTMIVVIIVIVSFIPVSKKYKQPPSTPLIPINIEKEIKKCKEYLENLE
ncbi:MAG: hypothetical protein QXS66_08855 [Thermoproteota archaeon]